MDVGIVLPLVVGFVDAADVEGGCEDGVVGWLVEVEDDPCVVGLLVDCGDVGTGVVGEIVDEAMGVIVAIGVVGGGVVGGAVV